MIIAIDPGLDGAVVGQLFDGSWLIEDTPTVKINGKDEYDTAEMVKHLRRFDVKMVVIERVGLRPGQSAQSSVKTGFGHGLWHGIIAALALPMTIVAPQKWQKAVLGAFPKGESKDRAFARAMEIAPGAVLMTPKGRKLYGRSDAICMHWWYEHIGSAAAGGGA